jgi:hypothetical protein
MSAAEQPRPCPLRCLPPHGFGFDHHAATPTLAFALRLVVLYGSVGKSAMPRARAEIFYYATYFATLIAVCITAYPYKCGSRRSLEHVFSGRPAASGKWLGRKEEANVPVAGRATSVA